MATGILIPEVLSSSESSTPKMRNAEEAEWSRYHILGREERNEGNPIEKHQGVVSTRILDIHNQS